MTFMKKKTLQIKIKIFHVCSINIISFIFMSDVILHISNEGCFTFIIHHFVWAIILELTPCLKKECKKGHYM